MPDNFTQIDVKVDGGPVAGHVIDRLNDVRVDLALGVPDRATLRFHDDWELNVSNSTTFALGKKLDVSISGDGDELVQVFSGEITEVDADFSAESAELVVTALETAHRLTHGSKTRTYLKMKDGEVVSRIATDYGLKSKVEVQGEMHEYLLQSCTDFAYLSERARAAGARWYVEKDTIHFVKDMKAPGPELTWGTNLLTFRTRTSVAEGAPDVSVLGWDPKTQDPVHSTQVFQPTALMVDTPFAKQAHDFGKQINGKRVRSEATATTVSEAKAIAGGLARRAAAEMASARGECIGDPKLLPGVVLSIKGVGPRISGPYVCTSVTHVFSGGDRFVSRFQCGGSDPRHLVDLLGGNTQRRTDATATWADRGLVIGIVTNNNDPEQQGRIKVRYPTLSDGAGPRSESDWARVLSIGAGAGRGMRSIPEIQDEVLVGFEHGDTRRPLVLGGLWSATKKPPGDNDTRHRKFFTLKSIRGSEMVLEDAEGHTNLFRVLLHKGAGLFQLGQEATKLESPSPITITGDRDITIKAVGKLVLEGREILLKSQTKTAVEGLTVEVNGTTGAKINSSGVTEVKGSILKLN